AGGADMRQRDAQDRGWAGQEPESKAEGNSGQERGGGVGPGPGAEAVIEHVRCGGQQEAARRREEQARPALQQTAEERLLERPVEDVIARLQEGVAGAGGNA